MPDSTPKRDDDGTFRAEVDDEKILDAVAEFEPAGTVDIGEAVGLARQNADYRLRQLRNDARVKSMKIGGTLVWSTVSSEEDTRPVTPESGVHLDGITFKRELTPQRREVLKTWLQYARDTDDGVTKSDFVAWWSDDRGAGTGYSKPGSFWEAFARTAMTESEKFHKPNNRTYQWRGSDE
jgi:hypothetical protein